MAGADAQVQRELTKEEALDALTYIHAELQKVAVMEPQYWQRREADLEARRVDVTNVTYKDRKTDLSYPAPGCGGGRWDGVPPGHKAQPIDLEVALPALAKLALPQTWAGYECLFGKAYLGSALARGAVWRAAQAHPEVEALRYSCALAASLH